MLTSIATWWALKGGLKGIISNIPRWAWVVLAVVIIVLLGLWFHSSKVSSFEKEIRADQKQLDQKAFDKQLADAKQDALKWKGRYETAQTLIANQERNRHEETVRNNAAIARDLSLRGPGAATSHCGPVSRAGTSSVSSRPQQTPSSAPAAGPSVSAGDWATVPWKWLVGVIQEHDDVISEAVATRSQHEQQEQLYKEQTKLHPTGNNP